MLCREIIATLENAYPKKAALSFDNVGLQAGGSNKNVHKIYIALDATDEVIEAAVQYGADMLITHHPLIFKPLKTVSEDDFIGRRLSKLIKSDMAYYAMHTNYDVLGMAQLAGELFELQESSVLESTYFESDREEGIGRVGTLVKPMCLRECCDFVKDKLKLENMKVFGDLTDMDKMYRVMAISPGSGKGMTDIALDKGAQLLVTGDIDHHEGIDAVARGLAVIDAGHYGTEYIFMADIERFLRKHILEVGIRTEEVSQPFHIIG